MFGVENCQILSNLRKYIEIYCISVIQILVSDTSHYENMPYKIPSNWCWTTIGELFYLQAGKFINASEITDCKDDLHSYPCYGGNGLRGYVTTYNRNGLFPIIGRQGALCGNINVAEGKFYATEHAVVVETFASVDVKVFVYFLIQLNLNQYATATAQPGLAVKTINEVPIPLPPLNEQYRISHAIEKAFNKMSIIDESKYSLCMCIQQFKAGVLDIAISGKLVPQDSSDEPAIELLKRINPDFVSCDNRHYENLPTGWQLAKIKDVFTINPKNKVDDDIDAGFVSMAMIDDGYRDSYQFEKKKWTLIKNGFTHFKDGDIAVAKISPCLENRKSMILKNLPNGIGAGTTELHIFRSAIVDPKFALYFFKSDHFINQCVGTFNGVVGQQRVGKNIIEDIIFPLPPYKEQRRISEKITQIFMYLDKITAEL